MAHIAGLPEPLQTVPPGPRSPDDPERHDRRAAWGAWARGVREYRASRKLQLRNDPSLAPYELEKCRRDKAYWLAVWGTIFEPRTNRAEGSGFKPFVPFAAQVDLFRTMDHVLTLNDEKGDLVISKSRAWGGTWTVCAWDLASWLFDPTFVAILTSRNFNLVDSKSPDSMFWKIESMFNSLPDWMRPAGWNPNEHDNVGLLVNPANGNTITGVATGHNLARGSRATVGEIDEGAAYPNQELEAAWDSLGGATDHRRVISTEKDNDSGEAFAKLQEGDEEGIRPTVVALEWWENPMLDDEWLERTQRRHANDPAFFAREYLRNRRAGNTTFVYPEAADMTWDDAVVPLAGAPTYLTWDPGHLDECWVIAVQEDPANDEWLCLDAYVNNKQRADFYGMVVSGQFALDTAGEFRFDQPEYDFAALVGSLPKATHVGDNYGNNVEGASGDTFYGRLLPYGIHVLRDRIPPKDASPFQVSLRTFDGRRRAFRDILPRMRFANTRGARAVLKAIQQHRHVDPSKQRTSAPKGSLHDWTSHPVSAMEFLAVHVAIRKSVQVRPVVPLRKAGVTPIRPSVPIAARGAGRAAAAV